MITKDIRVRDAIVIYQKLKERFAEFVKELKDKPPRGGFFKIQVSETNDTSSRLNIVDKVINMSLSMVYIDNRAIGLIAFERVIREDKYEALGNIYFDTDGDIIKLPDGLTEFHQQASLFRVEQIVVELIDRLIKQSSPNKGGPMKVRLSGSPMMAECDIQSPNCEAKDPKMLEPVNILPGKKQINVCKACRDDMIKKGIWVLV